jgi:hypothetical protein
MRALVDKMSSSHDGTASGDGCTGAEVKAYIAAIDSACCDDQDCSSAVPDTCDAHCAAVLLPFVNDCLVDSDTSSLDDIIAKCPPLDFSCKERCGRDTCDKADDVAGCLWMKQQYSTNQITAECLQAYANSFSTVRNRLASKQDCESFPNIHTGGTGKWNASTHMCDVSVDTECSSTGLCYTRNSIPGWGQYEHSCQALVYDPIIDACFTGDKAVAKNDRLRIEKTIEFETGPTDCSWERRAVRPPE